MVEELAKSGLYFDELSKIRILESLVSNQTNEIKESCKDFSEKVQDFEQIIESFLGILTRLGNEVEKKKLAAIGVRNSLKSITKDRERQQEKLQALISEKNTELEQLEAEYHSLQLLDVTQQETIGYLSQLQ